MISDQWVYFIGVFKSPKQPGHFPERDRTWGFYFTFEEAEQAVLGNYTDLFEMNYYDGAVIEAFQNGVGNVGDIKAWYRAVYNDPTSNDPVVTRLPEGELPVWAKQMANITLG